MKETRTRSDQWNLSLAFMSFSLKGSRSARPLEIGPFTFRPSFSPFLFLLTAPFGVHNVEQSAVYFSFENTLH
jgi:hypothetical protein